MAINYTWDVNTCDVYPTKSGKSNVVYTVHWKLTGTDDTNKDSDGNFLNYTMNGSIVLDISDLSNFTNWSDLTASKVQGWVEATMPADDLEARKDVIATKISKQKTPTSVQKTLG